MGVFGKSEIFGSPLKFLEILKFLKKSEIFGSPLKFFEKSEIFGSPLKFLEILKFLEKSKIFGSSQNFRVEEDFRFEFCKGMARICDGTLLLTLIFRKSFGHPGICKLQLRYAFKVTIFKE